MSFFNDSGQFVHFVSIVAGAFVMLLIYFRSHFDWYRELRGGLWVEMEHVHGKRIGLWRKKGFRYFGRWYGWSKWRSTGSTYPTQEYWRRRPIPVRWEVPEPLGAPQQPQASPERVPPAERTPLHVVTDRDREDRAA